MPTKAKTLLKSIIRVIILSPFILALSLMAGGGIGFLLGLTGKDISDYNLNLMAYGVSVEFLPALFGTYLPICIITSGLIKRPMYRRGILILGTVAGILAICIWPFHLRVSWHGMLVIPKAMTTLLVVYLTQGIVTAMVYFTGQSDVFIDYSGFDVVKEKRDT